MSLILRTAPRSRVRSAAMLLATLAIATSGLTACGGDDFVPGAGVTVPDVPIPPMQTLDPDAGLEGALGEAAGADQSGGGSQGGTGGSAGGTAGDDGVPSGTGSLDGASGTGSAGGNAPGGSAPIPAGETGPPDEVGDGYVSYEADQPSSEDSALLKATSETRAYLDGLIRKKKPLPATPEELQREVSFFGYGVTVEQYAFRSGTGDYGFCLSKGTRHVTFDTLGGVSNGEPQDGGC